jgi:hypothetical protein
MRWASEPAEAEKPPLWKSVRLATTVVRPAGLAAAQADLTPRIISLITS